MSIQKANIGNLFTQKKYNEIINIIENKIEKKDLTSQLLNILGACKLFKKIINMRLVNIIIIHMI